MLTVSSKIVRPDAKGRVSIGAFIHAGVSGFRLSMDQSERIILEPLVEKTRQTRSQLTVADLSAFMKTLPALSSEEKQSWIADIKKGRKSQSQPRNRWES